MNQPHYTSPCFNLFYDVNENTVFQQNEENYINQLSVKELSSLENVSLLDIFLSKGHIVEPHYHQNAAELVYVISGKARISTLNPFTNKVLTYKATPGQVVNIPKGWWHWQIALKNNTHLLAIFDAPTPEVILGSDILRKTPIDILAYTYCLDEDAISRALAPIRKSVFIGPPNDCYRTHSDAINTHTFKQYKGHHDSLS
ncbi:cupin domain-containing protein [Risungbinella massiliensis]|uniref:cupin domain-containing protein n=1 Tax=Risungbinella massiliensis TaxID=1329796 RepID=UPI0005CBFBE8|nr:cupin domain-containing protein [Risungbinella massiliensis]